MTIINGSRKSPRSVTRPRMVAELVVTITEPGSLRGCFGTSLESDGRTCAEAATVGNASGSAARSDRTPAGTDDETTNDDRCGEREQHELQLTQARVQEKKKTCWKRKLQKNKLLKTKQTPLKKIEKTILEKEPIEKTKKPNF